MTDKQIIEVIHRILSRGNDVEIRQKKDGVIVVMEAKKNIVTT